MPIYSHSQLSTFEDCPLRYKLNYIDKIRRDTEGVEAFLGNRVHETLKKCYEDARFTRIDTLADLLGYYDSIWQQNWHDEIIIMKKELTAEHYKSLGRKMLETYYRHYEPFDKDITLGTEKMLTFKLDDEGKYRMRGVIDRLARRPDGTHSIHDYKTSASLPSQEDIDRDRQLALYQIAVRQSWPDVQDVKLVWHYLAFDRELVSTRSDDAIAGLVAETKKIIERIESTVEFPPGESKLCEWCEYPDLCPNRRHLYMVEKLPENEYLKEPGVVLVNKLTELKDKAAEIEAETDKVREAILQYARSQKLTAIKGSDSWARIKFDQKLKFPGKNDAGRETLENLIIGAGKWSDCSMLDTSALSHIIQRKGWDAELIQQVLQHGKIEETSTVFLMKFKEKTQI